MGNIVRCSAETFCVSRGKKKKPLTCMRRPIDPKKACQMCPANLRVWPISRRASNTIVFLCQVIGDEREGPPSNRQPDPRHRDPIFHVRGRLAPSSAPRAGRLGPSGGRAGEGFIQNKRTELDSSDLGTAESAGTGPSRAAKNERLPSYGVAPVDSVRGGRT